MNLLRHIPVLLLLLVLAALPAAAQVEDLPSPEPQPGFEPLNTPPDARQADLMRARSLSRLGRAGEALDLYRRLDRQWPRDPEILEQYAETAADSGEPDLAESILADWLAWDPKSAGAHRLMARVLAESGRFEESRPHFEALLLLRPEDAYALTDYAGALAAEGRWREALEYYGRAADRNPADAAAAQAVKAILLERRPRLNVGYQTYIQPKKTVTETQFNHFSFQIADQTRLDLMYDIVHVSRPGDQNSASIEKTLQDRRARIIQSVLPSLDASLGLGQYEGMKDAFSQELGAVWRVHRPGALRLTLERNRPWYDVADAANYKGSSDIAALAYEGFFEKGGWGVFAEGRLRSYHLDTAQDYGTQKIFTGILSKRLLPDPDLTLSYAFYRTRYEYPDKTWTPVGMVEREALHTLSASLTLRPSDSFRLTLAGGAGQDEFKTSPAYFFTPSLGLRLGERLELGVNYEYRSDSDLLGGGETQTVGATLGFVF